jgi:PAS domain S-box-containing protein
MTDPMPHQKMPSILTIRPVRDGVIVGMVLFLVALIGIATTHQRGAIAYEEEVRSHLLDLAHAASLLIDGDKHELLTSPDQEGSDIHQQMIESLSAFLARVSGTRYVYTMVMVDDHPHFVLDAPSPFEPNEDVAGVMEFYPDADPEMLVTLRTGREVVTGKSYSDEWGIFMSAYVPLHNSSGEQVGIVGIDMTASEYQARLAAMRHAMWLSIGIAFVLSVIGGLAAGWMRRAMQLDRSRSNELINVLRHREMEVEEQRLLLSSILNSTADGILVLESIRDRPGKIVDLRIVMVNPAMERIINTPVSELEGERLSQCLPGTVETGLLQRYIDVAETGNQYADEIAYDRDGTEVCCAVVAGKLGDGLVITATDITNRKRMEQSLRKSEQHLRALVDTTPACVKIVAADGTLREINSAGLEYIEADDPSEAVALCTFDLIAPEHRHAFIEFHKRVCRGESGQLEFEVVGLRGTRRWMLTHAAPLVDPETGESQHVAVTHDISGRKQLDREMTLSRERFDLMAKATRDIVWDFDAVTNHLWWNDNLQTHFGYAADAVEPSLDWWEKRIHEDDRTRVVNSFNNAMADGSNRWSAEYRLRRADGAYAFVLDRAHIIRDEAGTPIRAVGAIVDLTKQKEAAEKIAFQKTLLECQSEASLDGILVVDNDRHVISHNRRFAEIWGIPDELLAAGDDKQLIASVLDKLAEPEAFLARTEELMRSPERSSEDEIHLRDGRCLDRYTTPVRHADGKMYGRVWFLRDVTDAKKHERELEQHKLVVENSNAVLFRWQNAPGWPVDLVSENVVQFGYTADELLGGDVQFATMVHPDDRDRVAHEVMHYVEQQASSFEQEYRLLCRDGTERWIYDRTVIERDDNGTATHFQGIIIDITERKNNERRMRQLLRDLRERVKENETLIRVLSLMHEQESNLPDTIQAIADAIPDGFQVPELTAVRIRIGSAVHFSTGYRETNAPRLVANFKCDDATTGSVEVAVLGSEQLSSPPELFLVEEEQLLRTIAESLRSYLDRHRAAEQLRRHKIVVENSNTVLFRWRMAPGWPVDLVSDNVNQFGYTADDLLDGTVSFESIVHPDDRKQIEQEVLECYDNGIGSIDQEYRIVCRDGSVRWVYDRTTAERDASGKVTHFQGIVIDVTDRKEAEERLRKNEELLRRVASQVPGALYQFRLAPDGARTYPYMSEGIVKLCGISTEELNGNPAIFEDMIVAADIVEFQNAVKESARTLQPWRTEFRVRHRDGSIRWISGTSIPQKEPDGSILWHGLIIDITDRKQAEEQLHRLTAIIEHTPDLVGMSNADLQPIYINPAGRRMLEIGLHEDLGQIHVGDFSASWAADVLENVAIPAAIRDGEWVGETAFLRADGSELPVSQVVIAHKDAAGQVAYFSTIARDMSRQKRIEGDLRQSQQFLRSTLDALSAHIAILDQHGRIIEVNKAWRDFAIANKLDLRHFGIGTNYISTCESASGECADGAATTAAKLRQILDGNLDHFELEYPCHSPDEKRWFMARATHFETAESRFAVVAHENITAHKLSEQAIQMSEHRLRRQTKALADIAHSTNLELAEMDAAIRRLMESAARTFGVDRVSIWFYDEERDVLRCNDLYESPHDRHSSGMEIRRDDCPEYFDALKRDRVLVLPDAQTDPLSIEFAESYLKPLDIQSMLDVPIWSSGELVGVLCHEHVGDARNWTADEVNFAASLTWIVALMLETYRRRETEQRLVIARDEAEAANRAKSEFLANMSHEIRTPMTAMLGFADLIKDASLSEPERREYLDVIYRNGNHLLGVINDILDISKIESGGMTIERMMTSPAQILSDAVSLMRARAIEKNLTLELEFATDIPERINTDPVRLRQILLNLIGNAIKFTNDGGVRVGARFRETPGCEPQLFIDIVDSGIGLTDEQVAKLFRPFVQADSSTTRRFGGSGLGLAISRQLAQLLGGDIEVSQYGPNGSTFTLSLPVEPSDSIRLIHPDIDALTNSTPAPEQAPTPVLNGRILLAEDGVDNQRLLSFLLGKAGADVTIVDDGKATIDVALKARDVGKQFDLILMDMQMPVMDGYAATRKLRESGYDGLIVALTAHATASDRDKCLAAGCDDYLTKPIDRATLVDSVHRYLHEHDAAA